MSRKTAIKRRAKGEIDEFTDLELRFIDEFMIDNKPGEALKRAGSTTKYPNQQGREMRLKPHIAREIQRRLVARVETATVSKAWVLTELVLTYEAAKAAASVQKGNTAERRIALQTLEKIGMHVDVNAFRAQIGLSNPDGSKFDLSGLNDEQLEQLENIVSALAIASGDSSGEGPTIQ